MIRGRPTRWWWCCTAGLSLSVAGKERVDLRRQFAAAAAAQRRDHEPWPLPSQCPHDAACARIGIARGEIGLVQHQPARLAVQRGVVFFQLPGERARFARRVGAVQRDQVNQVQEQSRAREVAQELVPETRALGCSFDQARDVGDHEAALALLRAADVPETLGAGGE